MTLACRIAVLASLFLANPVFAESSEYERAIDAAVEAFNLGQFDQATREFERAHLLEPSARTHRALGATYYELRNFALALFHIESALTDDRRPLTPEQQHEMRVLRAEAQAYVARVDIQVEPSSARVDVNGAPARILEQRMWLPPGTHRVEVSGPGFASSTRVVDAVAESRQELAVKLQPLDPPAAHSASVAPWIVAGAGGALLAASLGTGLAANAAERRLERACPNKLCADARDLDDVDTARTLATLTNVFLIGGSVTVAAGAIWLVLSTSDDTPPLTAACDTDGCAAAARLVF